MPRARWKDAEDSLARLMGTRRRPLSGSNQGTGSDDAMHKRLYLESKYGKQCSALFRLFKDTKKKAKKEGRVPILGFREPRTHGCLLVIHSDDLATVLREWAKANGRTIIKTGKPCE